MKTFLNLKQCLILFAAVFSLTSCLKSDDPDFQIVAGGYLQQVVNETSNPGQEGEEPTITVSYEFTPYCLVQSSEAMTDCKATGSSGIMSMQQITPYAYQTRSSTSTPDYSKISYSIIASNASGESASTTVSYQSLDKVMESKFESTISFEGGKGLTVEFNKVKNATAYMVLAKKTTSETLYDGATIVAEFTESDLTNTRELTINEATVAKNLEAGSYILETAAVINVSSYGILGIVVYQKGKSTPYTKE